MKQHVHDDPITTVKEKAQLENQKSRVHIGIANIGKGKKEQGTRKDMITTVMLSDKSKSRE